MEGGFQSFRSRVSSLFASDSPAQEDVDSSPKPRSGFRLFFTTVPEEARTPSHVGSRPTTSGSATGPTTTSSGAILTSHDLEQGPEERSRTITPTDDDESVTVHSGNGRRRAVGWVRPKGRKRRFCTGPGFKTRAAKRKMISCAISGTVLVIVLGVYMALALTTAIQGREFHIFLILILMLLTIYFCHSFVRLFMIASRAPGQVNTRVRFAEMEEPIRITFARDVENAAGEDTTQNQAITSPPPAYGLWRGSMRINPNNVYWQRVDQSGSDSDSTASPMEEVRPPTANRPPSYISDDGVQYAVEPRPQSYLPPPSNVPEGTYLQPPSHVRGSSAPSMVSLERNDNQTT